MRNPEAEDRRSWRDFRPVLALLMSLCFVAGGCAEERHVAMSPPDDEPCPQQFHASDARPAWSPDGKKLAFMSCETDSASQLIRCAIELLHLETGQRDTLLTGYFFLISSIDWSPEGTSLLLSTIEGIQLLEIGGDSLQAIKPGEYHSSASWSETSDLVFFSVAGSPGGTFSMHPDGTDLKLLSRREWGFGNPWVFSDSDSLVGMAWLSNPYCVVVLAPGDTALSDTIACGLDYPGQVQMHQDHRTILYGGATRCGFWGIMTVDRVTGVIDTLVPAYAYGFDISPDGQWVVYQDLEETGGLRMISLETREVRQLTRGE